VTPSPDLARLVRPRFPALSRTLGGRPCLFADAPGGTQVPDTVIEAMGTYLRRSDANTGGAFETSRETDTLIARGRVAGADLVGADPDEVVFGPNMTTLSFALARAVGRLLSPGDEVVVTVLEHDANVAPWLRVAGERGAVIRWVDVSAEDCTLDLASLDAALSSRTRVVAFTMASNAVGTVTPAAEIVRRARAAGAVAVMDAVHGAQHRAVDLRASGADAVFCSPYKVFGPHLGLMAARRELLEALEPERVRPASPSPPGSWETGTLAHEALAGFVAAVDYLAWIGTEAGAGDDGGSSADGANAGGGGGAGDDGGAGPRRTAVVAGMDAIRRHELGLTERFLDGIAGVGGARLWGIADPARASERTPTFALTFAGEGPRAVAEELGRRGVFVWDGNYYAQAIMERLGLEATGGAVRVGFCHYHTPREVDRALAELAAVAGR
jgi:cysteine desulfurase family protein (TIGR01976 family)